VGQASDSFFEGTHILLELRGVCDAFLNDQEFLRTQLVETAEVSGATVVQSVFHRFNPHGLSGVVVIAESHLAVHTWPEHGHACIDIFTCGHRVVAERMVPELLKRSQAMDHDLKVINRGFEFKETGLMVESDAR
jgi:S-adenosylmethionine decarboxylase